jgi:hypothetical protein
LAQIADAASAACLGLGVCRTREPPAANPVKAVLAGADFRFRAIPKSDRLLARRRRFLLSMKPAQPPLIFASQPSRCTRSQVRFV